MCQISIGYECFPPLCSRIAVSTRSDVGLFYFVITPSPCRARAPCAPQCVIVKWAGSAVSGCVCGARQDGGARHRWHASGRLTSAGERRHCPGSRTHTEKKTGALMTREGKQKKTRVVVIDHVNRTHVRASYSVDVGRVCGQVRRRAIQSLCRAFISYASNDKARARKRLIGSPQVCRHTLARTHPDTREE